MTEGGTAPCTELIEALLENSESLPVPGHVADDDACDLGSFRGSARFIEEAIRRARREPLPPVFAAYRDVYGRLPEGWPHPDM